MPSAAPSPRSGSSRGPRLLAALGLDRPDARAWAAYDWAISGMQTVVMSAVFPVYFVRVAAADLPGAGATQLLARWNAIALAFAAVLSPVLGAIADTRAAKKPFLAAFTALGAASTVALVVVQRGDAVLAGALFAACMVAGAGALVFYEALLPHVAPAGEIDRVSTAGYALGYVGGGALLALNLLWIQKPEWFGLPHGAGATAEARTLPVRLAFVSVGVWWVLFSLPLFRRVREPPRRLEPGERERAGAVRLAVARLGATVRELRRHRQAALMLVAFLVYNDGIQTIIKMAAAYGAEIGIGSGALIGAILMVQLVGIPFTFLFGALASRMGAKRAVLAGLAVYAGIALLGWRMRTAAEFFALAALVGVVQGGTQALSRSLFASMIPRHRSGELFGYWGVFEKFSGVLGPLAFDLVIGATGSSRSAVLAVIAFFAVGAALLSRVDVEAGRRAAAADEERSRANA
ncbi:MAG TPA: MFS transporter [Anaeromyxobacter sp.]|nr:MFS transporter [Anaeromyxobacter sp.]